MLAVRAGSLSTILEISSIEESSLATVWRIFMGISGRVGRAPISSTSRLIFSIVSADIFLRVT